METLKKIIKNIRDLINWGHTINKNTKIKITKINTLVTNDGKKKVYVTLSAQTPAIDIATELGLI